MLIGVIFCHFLEIDTLSILIATVDMCKGIPGFSLTFVFQESLGLPSVVFESPWANFKSPM